MGGEVQKLAGILILTDDAGSPWKCICSQAIDIYLVLLHAGRTDATSNASGAFCVLRGWDTGEPSS